MSTLSRTGLKSCCLALLLWPSVTGAEGPTPGPGFINNAALMPKYEPDDKVNMEGMSPDWVKTLVMAQFRIETATPEGTLASATKVLDHYAEMGVNGLWINPVYERDPDRSATGFNGYGNFGPHTIDPALTGTTDRDKSFAEVKTFVKEAHQRNIRVIFDIIVWGVGKGSPLLDQQKEFFLFNGARKEVWGGWAFNWDVPEMREWFVSAAVDFINRTGADGFRVDLDPSITGYGVFEEVRKRLYDQGKKVMIISEGQNERKGVYDFEQGGVGMEREPNFDDPQWQDIYFKETLDYYLRHSISDSIKTGKGVGIVSLQQANEGGKFRFYTYNPIGHDHIHPVINGSRLKMAYPMIFAPYIPMWFIGEEWNNPKRLTAGTGAMCFNTIDWATRDLPANRAFYEDVKKFLRIRRSHPEIFEYFPENHREANLVKVEAEGNSLESYARFRNGKAVIVVPNNSAAEKTFRVHLPFEAMGMDSAKGGKITDLLDEKRIVERDSSAPTTFQASVQPDSVGVYLVERSSEAP